MTTSLKDLADESEARLGHLIAIIESNGLEEASLGEAYHGRRGADALAHLHAWHLLLEEWLRGEAAGEDVVMPAPGHTWDRLDALNDLLYDRYKDLAYDEAKSLTLASREHLFETLRALPAERLTETSGHPWSPDPLISLVDDCSAHHYDWFSERIEAAFSGAE